MMSYFGLGRVFRGLLLTRLLTGLVNTVADAACNIIPPSVATVRATLASSDRPFARPGDWVRLTVDSYCAAASPGFVDAAEDYVVTVVFTPPNAGPRNVVVLAAN